MYALFSGASGLSDATSWSCEWSVKSDLGLGIARCRGFFLPTSNVEEAPLVERTFCSFPPDIPKRFHVPTLRSVHCLSS